ncbi:Trk system potassium uptake protein TrkA [Rodentibacter pneumotropicus]|uniref:Trk system potassium uptake protein TrkA n=1 Tax=Rodentibacter pneumotropicus TaxID=758 RepID=A0A448MJE0_9PAST|nr:Trk system potassium uptake protein TrkA [Rodentibacter pneumotropicus]
MRKGDVKNVASLHHGGSEAIEIVAHGDLNTSNIVGKLFVIFVCLAGALLAQFYVIMK